MFARIGTYIRQHHIGLLALFVALGGTAWALERNSVESQHIAPDQVRAADVSDALRLECRDGTRYHEGACFETVARAPATWTTAMTDCIDEGFRLPAPVELAGFRLEPGVTFGDDLNDKEWTYEHDQNSQSATVVVHNGFVAADVTSTSLPYRCVARAKR